MKKSLVLALVVSALPIVGCSNSPFAQWESGMLPERKVVAVRQLREQEVPLAMVTTERKFRWWETIFRDLDSSPIKDEERDSRTLIFQ